MNFIKDILRGVAIGIANIIPGVSGGTMMVSMGIYQDVLKAVTGILKHGKESIKTLFPYAVGMGMGIIGLSFVISSLFETYPFPTAMLFIGLIFGGIPLLLPKAAKKRPSVCEIGLFAAFFLLIIWIQFLNTEAEKSLTGGAETMVLLFLVGGIAAATMVVPGVSGSMVLMALGYYKLILSAINQFIVAALTFEMQSLCLSIKILMPFGVGMLLGIFFVAKLIDWLLKKQERKTYFAILGLVMASPIAVLSGISGFTFSFPIVIFGILMFFMGCGTAWLLGK